MCEPATIAIIGAGIAIAGTAASGYMQIRQANFEKNIARENARRENLKAVDAISRNETDQQNLARKYAGAAGAQRAAVAANGIDVDFGSAADMQADTSMYYREDATNLNRNLGMELQGIDMQASNFTAGAKAAGMKATGAAISTAFDIAGTTLGAVGKYNKASASASGA